MYSLDVMTEIVKEVYWKSMLTCESTRKVINSLEILNDTNDFSSGVLAALMMATP